MSDIEPAIREGVEAYFDLPRPTEIIEDERVTRIRKNTNWPKGPRSDGTFGPAPWPPCPTHRRWGCCGS